MKEISPLVQGRNFKTLVKLELESYKHSELFTPLELYVLTGVVKTTVMNGRSAKLSNRQAVIVRYFVGKLAHLMSKEDLKDCVELYKVCMGEK